MPPKKKPQSKIAKEALIAAGGVLLTASGFLGGAVYSPADLQNPLLNPPETLEQCTEQLAACDLEFRGPVVARVKRITDGDTFHTESGHAIRILGINTPEKARKGNPAEPFSVEATAFAVEKLLGKTVHLGRGRENADYFSRLLRWVFYDEDGKGKFYEEEILRRGLAFFFLPEGDEGLDPELVERLKAAEAEAKEKGLGIWSE